MAASLKPSAKGVTTLVIVAVVVLFGCVLAYLGAAGKLKSATAELRKKELEVKESRKMAQALEKSKLEYLDAQSQVRYLESSVSTKAYIPTLLKQIEYLGKSVNLKVVAVRPDQNQDQTQTRKLSSGKEASEGNVQSAQQTTSTRQPKPAKKPEPYDDLSVNLELEGKYLNALDFLYKLTTFPKIVAVDSVDIAPSNNEMFYNSPKLNIKIKVTAYVLKDNPTPMKPDVPVEADGSSVQTARGGASNEPG